MGARLNWVVALMPEAHVIIEQYGLRRVPAKSAHFPRYESDCGSVGLIVSGIGKVQAAAATMSCLHSSDNEVVATGWINFGIAGCSHDRYGEAILASKITDGGTGRCWYPVPTWEKKKDLARLPVTTVDRPFEEYSQIEGLVEMEASGFYPIALKESTSELSQVVKIVSDGPGHSLGELNKKNVLGLCREAWPAVYEWVEAFRQVMELEAMRLDDPPGFSEWVAAVRFTETQKHQLRRLLQDWAALSPGTVPFFAGTDSPREALRSLRQDLSDARKKKKRI